MNHPDKVKLLGGPYRPPSVRPGQRAVCLYRGEVHCCGTSSAPMPWPWARKGAANRPTPIVNRELARAIRTESEAAVVYWWGVSEDTAWRWRKALNVPAVTQGTHRLKSLHAQTPAIAAARTKGQAKNQDPERRRKISEAKKGKPRPAHVVEAIGNIWRGKRLSEEHRAKMREARRRRSHRPWTKEEDEVLAQLPALEAARRLKRSLRSVYKRRHELGLPDGRRRK